MGLNNAVLYKNKRILVCGAAKSGISSARLLRRLGADVTLSDLKAPAKPRADLDELEALGVRLSMGANPDGIVTDFDIVVLSPGISVYLPFAEAAYRAGVTVIGEIELAAALCECPIIGITGTNGKTTTTALTGAIFRAFNPKTRIVGNIGDPFTDKVLDMDEDGWAVAEISSFQLETAVDFRPKISAILNITPDHLDRHRTMEIYAQTKMSIGKNQTSDDFMILNYDDELCRAAQTRAKRVFFSDTRQLDEGAFLDGGDVRLRLGGMDEKLFNISELNILGAHNAQNALAAVAMAACAGVPLDVIAGAAKSFKAVEHRIEFVREVNGVRFYNDSKATNTDAAIKGLEAMARPVVLIGGGYDKHADFLDWARLFGGKVKNLVVIGEVADKIIETCRACGFEAYERANTLKDAVDAAFGKAAPGDCVLLSPACASWDMFDNFEQRGNLFKEFVMEL